MRAYSPGLSDNRPPDSKLRKGHPADIATMIEKYSTQVLFTLQSCVSGLQKCYEAIASWNEAKRGINDRQRDMKLALVLGDEALYDKAIISAAKLYSDSKVDLNCSLFQSQQEKLITRLKDLEEECYFQSLAFFQAGLHERGIESVSSWSAIVNLRACMISALNGEFESYDSLDRAVQSYTRALESALLVVAESHPLARLVRQRLDFCDKMQKLNSGSN